MLVDTHAHIHFDEFVDDLEAIFDNCRKYGVGRIITVGTDELDSKKALEFIHNEDVIKKSEGVKLYATVGLHPHEAKHGNDALLTIEELAKDGGYGKKLVAIGECGLDFYRNNSSKRDQYRALEFQIELALELDLPLVFHVRDAWDDFFGIIKNYPNLCGVVHSFTGGIDEIEKASQHNLYFGLNGIITFTKDQSQLEAIKLIPSNRLLLETDCPFLSPEPLRGKRNEPANVALVGKFLAKLRGDQFSSFCQNLSYNAEVLFRFR